MKNLKGLPVTKGPFALRSHGLLKAAEEAKTGPTKKTEKSITNSINEDFENKFFNEEKTENQIDENLDPESNSNESTVSVSTSSLLPMHHRYQTKKDLEDYSKHVLGKDKLDTFIVPDIQKILTIMRKNMAKQDKRKHSEIVDEFQHMTNWQSAFEHIWMEIRWLNSFSHINELALRKILKKFSKNFFENKDNPIRSKLSEIVGQATFQTGEAGLMSEELQILCDDMLKFYADCFCTGDLKEARSQLDGHQNQVRRQDLWMIALFGGMILMLIPLAILLLMLKPQKQDDGSEEVNWD